MGVLIKTLIGVLCFNMCFLYFLTLNYKTNQNPAASSLRIMSGNANLDPQDFKFVDPNMAYQILTKLDVSEPDYNGRNETEGEELYKRFYLGLTADNDYCDKHRAYFANNPDYVFKLKNFVTGYYPADQIRNLTLAKYYNDSMPHVGYHRSWDIVNSFAFEMNLNSSLIVTFEPMFYHRHVMRQFSCLAQMSNHIPGHEDLYRKDKAAKALSIYSQTYQTRPQCFNNRKFFPKSYLLFEEDQCLEFFKVFNSDAYQQEKKAKGIVYMRKIGAFVHAGQGVFPVDKTEEDSIRELYQNGSACGKIVRNNIIQHFIHNTLLINGFKFDFRMFMVIASTNPFIAYYHDGFLRISGEEYDPFEGGKNSLLANVAQGRMSFDEFRDYLLDKGMISDNNWLDNYLRPEFKKAMVHIVRMGKHNCLKRSSVFELYGIDFMIDEDLNLWFIEANIMPSTNSNSADGLKLKSDITKNMFDIVFGLIRSRMKRVYLYVNDLIVSGEAFKLQNGQVFISDLDEKLKEFQQVIKNRMEPEFEVGPDNTYVKIVDENYSGTAQYMGMISEECL